MELTFHRPYIEERNGGLYVAGKRVSLDSVLHEYKNGAAPESIARSFPVLDLEDACGAITFTLANREAVDAYLEESDRLADSLARESAIKNRDLTEKRWEDGSS